MCQILNSLTGTLKSEHSLIYFTSAWIQPGWSSHHLLPRPCYTAMLEIWFRIEFCWESILIPFSFALVWFFLQSPALISILSLWSLFVFSLLSFYFCLWTIGATQTMCSVSLFYSLINSKFLDLIFKTFWDMALFLIFSIALYSPTGTVWFSCSPVFCSLPPHSPSLSWLMFVLSPIPPTCEILPIFLSHFSVLVY